MYVDVRTPGEEGEASSNDGPQTDEDQIVGGWFNAQNGVVWVSNVTKLMSDL